VTRARLLPCSVRKEFRALATPWLACFATLVAAAAFGGGPSLGLAVPAYFVGAVALGALSVGHEYSHRTIGLLLSLPVRRERLFLEKLGVLAALLLTLYAAAAVMMGDTARLHDAGGRATERAAMLVLPVLCGLFVAPWLTMLCRGPVAGTVFSIAVPGLLLVLGEAAGVLVYGSRSAAADFRLIVLWIGMLAACGIGGVSSWRLFRHLEAVDDRGEDVRLPEWLRRPIPAAAVAPRATRHPVWLLVAKELRLQQMPLVLGALYLLAWVGVSSVRHLFPPVTDIFTVLTVFYCGLIALLIGCLAFAEERQIGTLQWQLLLPMATWKQWSVKVGVALGLALVLGLGVPALVAGGMQLLPAGLRHEPIDGLVLALPAVVLTVTGLYVSSLCSSGLRALLMSIPAVLGTALFVGMLERPLTKAAFALVSYVPASMIPRREIELPVFIPQLRLVLIPQLSLLLVGGLLALLLRFGYVNYRSTDRVRSRTMKQVMGLACGVAIALMVVSAVMALGVRSYHRPAERGQAPGLAPR